MNTYTIRKRGLRRAGGIAAILVGSLGLVGQPGTAQAQQTVTRKPTSSNGTPVQTQRPPAQQPAIIRTLPPVYTLNPNANRYTPLPSNGGTAYRGGYSYPNRGNYNGGYSRNGYPSYYLGQNPRPMPNAMPQGNLQGRSVPGIHPNPPGTAIDNLFGGRPGGSQYYPPSSGLNLLFGGNVTPPQNLNSSASLYHYGGYFGPTHPRHYYSGWGYAYFTNGWAFYPYYYPSFVYGVTVLSPYAYYYNVCPPYIDQTAAYNAPPQYIYVPVPVYNDVGSYQGWKSDDVDDYYLNRQMADPGYRIGENSTNNTNSVQATDSAVQSVADDIRKAWQDGNIDLLAKHIRPDSQIAVYLRGQYQYSLDTGAYLDMTRDAFHNTKTVSFALDRITRKQNGVYSVTGHHVYKDNANQQHTVYISFVLEKTDKDYIITQVGTAPDQVKE
jgi:hypothetical protein